MTYFVEFDTESGKQATFHGFYETAQAAMDAGQRALIEGTHFRVIAFEPRIAAICTSGTWRMRAKCRFCGDIRSVDRDGNCGICLEGMYRTKGD